MQRLGARCVLYLKYAYDIRKNLPNQGEYAGILGCALRRHRAERFGVFARFFGVRHRNVRRVADHGQSPDQRELPAKFLAEKLRPAILGHTRY